MIFGIFLFLLITKLSFESSNHKHFTTQISEELPRKTKVIDLGKLAEKWFPNDLSNKPSYKFQFFNCEKTSVYFHIDSNSGLITVERRIDRDNLCHLISTCCPKKNGQCTLDLTIKSDNDFSHIIVLVIDVKDINDNVPFWIQSELVVQFSEGSELGDSKSLIIAMDNDVGPNGVSYYKMFPEIKNFILSSKSNPNEIIFSNKEQPRLILKEKLDRETNERYEFILTAFDGGNPSYNGSVKVIVIVTDENDNSPVFEKNTYTVSVNENLLTHTSVIQTKAYDADKGMNGKIEYQMSSLTKQEYSRLFSVDSNSGHIRVRWELDYETYTTITLIVEANDMGNLPRGTTCTVIINIRDLNDNSPEIYFEPSRFTNNAKIIENEAPGKLVAVFSVQDKDSNENGKVTCHLDPIANNEFSLDRMNIPLTVMYKICTIKSFDREKTSKVTAKIICFDEGLPRRLTRDSVTVGVEDVNDEIPYFNKKIFYFSIDEDVKPGNYLFTVNATDKDEGINALLSYSISGKDASKFTINERTSRIHLEKELDREILSILHFNVKAEDTGFPKQSASVNITIKVKDKNDNAPILPKVIHLYILENHTYVIPVVQINSTDIDEGSNAEIKMTLLSETAKTIVTKSEIHSNHVLYNDIIKTPSESSFLLLPDGKLLIRDPGLDRESIVKHELMIEASDRGNPPMTSQSLVIVNVEDINDCKPIFRFPSRFNSSVKVKQGTVSGSTIAQILAFDNDEGINGKISYSFKSNNPANELFLMHPDSGRISLQQTVRETHQQTYILIVVAKDGGIPSLEDTARLQITIESINVNSEFDNPSDKSNVDTFLKRNNDHQTSDCKIQSNIVIVIVLVCIAAMFIIAMSLATAVLVCRKMKRNRNYEANRDGFQWKHSFKNWKMNIKKPFLKKRQQLNLRELNQTIFKAGTSTIENCITEPGQSLIQKNINSEDHIQPNFTFESNNSYFLNPLSINFIPKTNNNDGRHSASINYPNYPTNHCQGYEKDINIAGMSTYFTLNRSRELCNFPENFQFREIHDNRDNRKKFPFALTDRNQQNRNNDEFFDISQNVINQQFLNGSNV